MALWLWYKITAVYCGVFSVSLTLSVWQSGVSVQLLGQRVKIFTLARQQTLHLSSCPCLSTQSVWQAREAEPTYWRIVKVSPKGCAFCLKCTSLWPFSLAVCCVSSCSFSLSYCWGLGGTGFKNREAGKQVQEPLCSAAWLCLTMTDTLHITKAAS